MKYETYVEYRDKANTYDSKIAKETGIPKSTFTGWKDGMFTPKFDKQEKIAKVLNIPFDKLFAPDSTKAERRKKTEETKGKKEGGA